MDQKFGCLFYKIIINTFYKFQIFGSDVVFPETNQEYGCLIFLDRELPLAIFDPRVPRAAERAIRLIFVQDIPVFSQHIFGKSKKSFRYIIEADHIKDPSGEASVSRPDIAISVSPILNITRVC